MRIRNIDTGNPSIAIIGSRGIPNRYGGFEKFAEIISTELVKNGNTVYVSCEYASKQKIKEYKGVNLFYFPIKSPKIGLIRIIYEFLYDGYSLLWASKNVDYVYMLGYSAAILFFIPKLFGKRLFVNHDGIEWKRSKFSPLIKYLLKLSEKISIIWADEIIADSKEIKRYLDDEYNINSIYIPYGASEVQKVGWKPKKLPESLKEININPSYYLVVARLEPENNIEIIVEGYLKSKTEKPLIIIGDFANPDYKHKVKKIIDNNSEDKKIIFTGGIYDPELLNMLRQNCCAYIHGHSVGGTNPSLLEAMISKNLIIAHDNEFNREVCGNSGIFFRDSDDLMNKIDLMEKDFLTHLKLKNKAYYKVKDQYVWNNVVNRYNLLLNSYNNEIEVDSTEKWRVGK